MAAAWNRRDQDVIRAESALASSSLVIDPAFFDDRDERYKPPAELELCDPRHVADAVMFALTRPPGCEVRELVVTPPDETSWP